MKQVQDKPKVSKTWQTVSEHIIKWLVQKER